jgi:hypothetical protein
MKSLQILLSAFVLSLVLSACGEGSDPESNETASNPENETIVSNDGETADDTTNEDEETSEDGTSDDTQTPVAPAPAPAPEGETSSDETSSDEASSDEASSDETSSDEASSDEASSDETSSDETSSDETSVDDEEDTAQEESTQEESAQPALGAAQLNSATVSGEDILLRWSQDFTAPDGGYDIVIDGQDMGTHRTSATSATISGLDLTQSHCFVIESRYIDASQFLLSNELCTEAQTAANQAPTISGDPVTSVDADVAYSFTPEANDDDGDTLTFSVANLPAWASFNTSNGSLTGTPTAQDIGDYNNIRISVSDGTDSAQLAAFSIHVNSVEVVATTGSMSLMWTAPSTRTDGSSLSLSEIDGYRIYIGTTQNNMQVHLDLSQGDLSSYTIDNLELGDYYVAISAYDSTGNASDLSNIVQKSVVN